MSIEEYLDQDERKDLLRLLTAGSVDDGKSTLIGRLLFDSKKLYEDQLSALERDSRRVGNAIGSLLPLSNSSVGLRLCLRPVRELLRIEKTEAESVDDITAAMSIASRIPKWW